MPAPLTLGLSAQTAEPQHGIAPARAQAFDDLAVLPEHGLNANAVYTLGSGEGETSRLQRLADELGRDSCTLLDRVGLGPGESAIDVGGGPRGILDLLAEQASPGAWVVTCRLALGPMPGQAGLSFVPGWAVER